MDLKTLHFVPGLSRTPLLFIPRSLTNIFFKNMLQKEKSRELEISKVDPGKLVDSFSPRDWAPVSEPGFLDFQISRFSILDIFRATYFRKVCW